MALRFHGREGPQIGRRRRSALRIIRAAKPPTVSGTYTDTYRETY